MAGETTQADATAENPTTTTQDEDRDEDFDAGFASASTGKTETPDPATAQQPAAKDDSTQDPATQAAGTTTETPPAAAPKKVEIEEGELQQLRTRASAAESLQEQLATTQKKFDQAFGQIGSLKQAIDKLRVEAPAGAKVEVSEEDFRELVEAYPDIGKMTVNSLNKVLTKVRGTGGADPEAIDRLVAEHVQAARGEIKTEVTDSVLNGIIPRWRQAVNTPAFDTWLKSQQAEVQALAESDDLGDAATMLRMYRRHTERPAPTPAPTPAPAQGKPAASARQRQIASAVTTRGDGTATVATTSTEDDDFDSGFKSGKV